MFPIFAGVVTSPAEAQSAPYVRVAVNATQGDFDGDGLADGVYGDTDYGATTSCLSGYGAVVVHYGNDPTIGERWARGVGLNGVAVCGGQLGHAVAAGDYNNDGYDDLAIGVPGPSTGAVQILYGSSTGLVSAGQQTFNAASTDSANARFGHALAAGDFDCDGDFDIAVGLPNATVGTLSTAGRVGLLQGGTSGVTNPGTRYNQGTTIGETAESGDNFGQALTAGNFNADSSGGNECWDLAASAPNEDISSISNAGLVHVMNGRTTGLTTGTNTRYYQNGGTLGSPVTNQRFGIVLGAGDINGNTIDDLAITLATSQTLAWYSGGSSGLGTPTIVSTALLLTPSSGPADSDMLDDPILTAPCIDCCGPEGTSCCIGWCGDL
jgi:hypothetical protein